MSLATCSLICKANQIQWLSLWYNNDSPLLWLLLICGLASWTSTRGAATKSRASAIKWKRISAETKLGDKLNQLGSKIYHCCHLRDRLYRPVFADLESIWLTEALSSSGDTMFGRKRVNQNVRCRAPNSPKAMEAELSLSGVEQTDVCNLIYCQPVRLVLAPSLRVGHNGDKLY